jgi:uncharacterized protein (DUF1800 family)
MRWNLLLIFLLAAAPARTTLTENQKILHVLNRVAFGARPGDIERVRQMGVDKYIDQQLHPERIDDGALDAKLEPFTSLKMDREEILQANPPRRLLVELQGQKIVRAVSSERQLNEVMTDFWFNHFNVFWGKGANRQLTTSYEMNAIRPHVFGKFKDLVMATAKSPAMLFYLDNARSSARTGINENYARELIELHTIGVDGGYSQKVVQEVARAFTGWTIDRPRQGGDFIFRPMMHDPGEKLVLGHRINGGGIRDGEQVIDILVHHPSTARFIATKLVRRFVSDEPPQSLVDRVASTYKRTDGDIREMLRTIFVSDEFYSLNAYRAKTKSPFELVVSSVRAVGSETNGSPRLAQQIARMGQPLYQYQAPTGFPDRASQWTSSGTLVERLNFGVALAGNRIQGTRVNLMQLTEAPTESDRAVDQAVRILLAGDVSESTRTIVIDQVRSSTEPAVVKAFALLLGSPEFQKR